MGVPKQSFLLAAVGIDLLASDADIAQSVAKLSISQRPCGTLRSRQYYCLAWPHTSKQEGLFSELLGAAVADRFWLHDRCIFVRDAP